MDYIGYPHTVRMSFYKDRPDILTTVRWYYCEDGAATLPFYTRFASGWHDRDFVKDWQGVGQIGLPLKWGRAVTGDPLDGVEPSGTADQFANGVLWSDHLKHKLPRPGCLPTVALQGSGQDSDGGSGDACKLQYKDICLHRDDLAPRFWCVTASGFDGHGDFELSELNRPFTLSHLVEGICTATWETSDRLSTVFIEYGWCVKLTVASEGGGEIAIYYCFDDFDIATGPIHFKLWEHVNRDVTVPLTITVTPNSFVNDDGHCEAVKDHLPPDHNSGQDYDDGGGSAPVFGSGQDYDTGLAGPIGFGKGHDYDSALGGTNASGGSGMGQDYDAGHGQRTATQSSSGQDHDSVTAIGGPPFPPPSSYQEYDTGIGRNGSVYAGRQGGQEYDTGSGSGGPPLPPPSSYQEYDDGSSS